MPTSPPQHRPAWIPSKAKVRQLNGRDYNRYSRRNQEFYQSRQWRKISKWFRVESPLCEHCKSKGIAKAAQLVDHIEPISQGGDMYSRDNLQSLCISCHNTKTAAEG